MAKLSTKQLAPIVNKASQQYGIPQEVIYAVIKQESGFNSNAKSHVGAGGLMQLMPATAKSLGVSNRFDPEENIMGGTKYLAQQYEKFGDIRLALAAYNAGPGAVTKHKGIPPYKETKNYVKSIMGNLNRDPQLEKGTLFAGPGAGKSQTIPSDQDIAQDIGEYSTDAFLDEFGSDSVDDDADVEYTEDSFLDEFAEEGADDSLVQPIESVDLSADVNTSIPSVLKQLLPDSVQGAIDSIPDPVKDIASNLAFPPGLNPATNMAQLAGLVRGSGIEKIGSLIDSDATQSIMESTGLTQAAEESPTTTAGAELASFFMGPGKITNAAKLPAKAAQLMSKAPKTIQSILKVLGMGGKGAADAATFEALQPESDAQSIKSAATIGGAVGGVAGGVVPKVAKVVSDKASSLLQKVLGSKNKTLATRVLEFPEHFPMSSGLTRKSFAANAEKVLKQTSAELKVAIEAAEQGIPQSGTGLAQAGQAAGIPKIPIKNILDAVRKDPNSALAKSILKFSRGGNKAAVDKTMKEIYSIADIKSNSITLTDLQALKQAWWGRAFQTASEKSTGIAGNTVTKQLYFDIADMAKQAIEKMVPNTNVAKLNKIQGIALDILKTSEKTAPSLFSPTNIIRILVGGKLGGAAGMAAVAGANTLPGAMALSKVGQKAKSLQPVSEDVTRIMQTLLPQAVK